MNAETLYYVHRHVWPAAMALLPGAMNTQEAEAEILAAGLQESEFEARVQGSSGPAHGYWQFERNGGVKELLSDDRTASLLATALHTLNYPRDVKACYNGIVDNDVLACCFARVLLWKFPERLPTMNEPQRGWEQYNKSWRPGKPRPKDWPDNFAEAWKIVLQG